MKIVFLFLLLTSSAFAQPVVELTPDGFLPVTIARPPRPDEKLIELSRTWASEYLKDGYDVYNVTENSFSIDGFRKNAFFYRNVGETYYHNITFTMNVAIKNSEVTITFGVKEIFAKKTLLKNTLADYFTPDGKLKEDMDDVKPSLEATFNRILKSYAGFISN